MNTKLSLPVIKLLIMLFLTGSLAGCSDDDPAEILQKDRQKILEYIEEHDLDAYEHESGIFVVVEKEGTGEPPGPSSVVLMSYVGYFLDEEVFDSGQDVYLDLSRVVAGFRLGVMEFGRGGKGTILIPSQLGYGPRGSGDIPGNTVIIFDIDIIDYN